jgi:hypothetical protein
LANGCSIGPTTPDIDTPATVIVSVEASGISGAALLRRWQLLAGRGQQQASDFFAMSVAGNDIEGPPG